MPDNTRFINHKNGIYIVYQIDEIKKEIRLLGALGKNRFHETAQEAAKQIRQKD